MPIWVSEASLARTRERRSREGPAKGRAFSRGSLRLPKWDRRACSHAKQNETNKTHRTALPYLGSQMSKTRSQRTLIGRNKNAFYWLLGERTKLQRRTQLQRYKRRSALVNVRRKALLSSVGFRKRMTSRSPRIHLHFDRLSDLFDFW